MKHIASFTESVQAGKGPKGPCRLVATGEAQFNESRDVLFVHLDCFFQPAGCATKKEYWVEDWLPKRETAIQAIPLAEALLEAEKAFKHWVEKIRRTIPEHCREEDSVVR